MAKENSKEHVAKTGDKKLIIAIATSVALGIMLIFTIGAFIVTSASRQNRQEDFRSSNSQSGFNTMSGNNMRGGAGQFGQNSGESTQGDADTSSTRVNGVVTAIDGNTITVAGNGQTVSVTKTDTTTIGGTSDSLAVNDTVIVTGTTSDGVFTATTITIRNSSN